jgi:hypothetical protein
MYYADSITTPIPIQQIHKQSSLPIPKSPDIQQHFEELKIFDIFELYVPEMRNVRYTNKLAEFK